MKIAFFSSYTVDLLVNELNKLISGIEWYIPPFDTYAREIYTTNLQEFSPDLVIVSLDSDRLVADMTTEGGITLSILTDLARKYPVLVHNCVCLNPISLKMLEWNDLNTYQARCLAVNQHLYNCRQRNINIVDLNDLITEYGREKMCDPRLYYLSKSPFSHFGLKKVANQLKTSINILQGKRKKCLVLDLDNTLWGGVLGEVGADNIQLSNDGTGKAFYDFQKHIKKLQKTGVLLAICSKNDENIAMDAIRNHPYMLLKENAFVAWRINWKDKATNIKEIADELNIGTDSMVFLDDSSVERDSVKTLLPEVMVPDLPSDPAFYSKFISELPCFETFSITNDDKKRGQMYTEDRERKKQISQYASFEEYLESLNIAVKITKNPNPGEINRASQLTLRTNQFNLTTRRYTSNELLGKINNGSKIYLLSAKDKFGDYGNVGLAIVDFPKEDVAQLDVFLLSCRVIGRGIEKALLSFVMNDIKAQTLQGEYLPTQKNSVAKEFLVQNGFNQDTLIHDMKNIPSSDKWIKYE